MRISDSSSGNFSQRYLRFAVIIFYTYEVRPGSYIMQGALVGDVSETEGGKYYDYEVAVTLSWPLAPSDLDTGQSGMILYRF